MLYIIAICEQLVTIVMEYINSTEMIQWHHAVLVEVIMQLWRIMGQFL